jgi:D-3-phosphoglycerate dehydrogenase
MDVVAYDPAVPVERAEQYNVALVPLEELLAKSDFVTVHVPLVEATRGLIGARELELMKPRSRLINAARGGVVDERALFEALKSGRPAVAAADVFEHEPPGESPLLTLTNFIATPHIAASTEEAQTSVAFDVAEEVAAVLAGELPRHTVNAPALPPEELAFLRPFADLAEKLGTLHVQLEGGRLSELELSYEGEVAEHDVALLTAAAIRGVVAGFVEDRVNAVNARLVAAQRGIRLTERRTPRSTSSYPSLVGLRVGESQLSGTVLFGEPRVIAIGPFRVDLVPAGRFLVSRHRDRPGVVGRFGTILGGHDINIASMQVGRDAPRGRAMMILQVDDPVPEPVLAELRAVPGMEDLRYLEL